MTWFLSVEYQVIVSCHLHSALNCYKPFLTDTNILYTHLIFSPQKLIRRKNHLFFWRKTKLWSFWMAKSWYNKKLYESFNVIIFVEVNHAHCTNWRKELLVIVQRASFRIIYSYMSCCQHWSIIFSFWLSTPCPQSNIQMKQGRSSSIGA